jgi:cytochrome c553
MGTAPRLAGQHRAYLQMQLQAFSTGARISDPMTRHVWFISPDQAMAVANYLGR